MTSPNYREIDRMWGDAREVVKAHRAGDDAMHDLRRVLTGALNDVLKAQDAKIKDIRKEQGVRSKTHRRAIERREKLWSAHNTLQSLQVDYSHARMLLQGIVAAHDKEDANDVAFHLRLAREYFEVRQ